jgi:hypothetical protein
MVTIILAIALLITIAVLAVEIGIVSWNICRTGRYLRKEAAAEHTAERAVKQWLDATKRVKFLDEYASKISWLLHFLYNRYDKFVDLENEVNEGLKDEDGDTPLDELDLKYNDLKKALKIVRVTMKAIERMDNPLESIASQVEQIMEDLQVEDEESESEEPSEDKKKNR